LVEAPALQYAKRFRPAVAVDHDPVEAAQHERVAA
jgi:hypothetical protein